VVEVKRINVTQSSLLLLLCMFSVGFRNFIHLIYVCAKIQCCLLFGDKEVRDFERWKTKVQASEFQKQVIFWF
jgi:hypothetical protein